MTKIKICGIRRKEDVRAVNRYKPDCVGFVFAESRRRVSPDEARALAALLSPEIVRVGVFVNELPERVAHIAEWVGLDILQLHGDEDAVYIQQLRALTTREIWKVLRMRDTRSLEAMMGLAANRFLLDAYSPVMPGGSGVPFDWLLLAGVDMRSHILAGGLDAGNVVQAVQHFHPWMVDISSGAETDGHKDEQKIQQLIQLIRGADNG